MSAWVWLLGGGLVGWWYVEAREGRRFYRTWIALHPDRPIANVSAPTTAEINAGTS